MVRVVRGVGWTLLVAGAVILLYVVYLLWFTNLGTEQAQREMAERWEARTTHEAEVGDDDADADDADDGDADATPDAFAMLWFERDGDPVVSDDPLYVVPGVGLDELRDGPGHYPESAEPGEDGNVGIAGHRTTYGSPFWSLDELREGDTIHVVDHEGEEWVYEYVEQRVVAPSDTWVVGDDPLDNGAATITLTTCHPRFSAAQRLVAFGELRTA